MSILTLKTKKQETDDIISLEFTSSSRINFNAGQYYHLMIPSLFFQFHKPARDISFASSPNDSTYLFTINTKSNSKFKQKIKNLNVGDKILGFKPSGKMPNPDLIDKPVVMIAQGVGITPFRSMIYSVKNLKNFTLVHVDRKQYCYQQELEKLDFMQYRITKELLNSQLQTLVNSNNSNFYYIAGASNFVIDVYNQLISMNVDKTKIVMDKFKGLLN